MFFQFLGRVVKVMWTRIFGFDLRLIPIALLIGLIVSMFLWESVRVWLGWGLIIAFALGVAAIIVRIEGGRDKSATK